MSLINDALERAKEKQQASLSSFSQSLSGTGKGAKRKRLIWLGAALVCLVGVFFVVQFVNNRSNSAVQAMLSGSSPGAYYLREANLEIPFKTPSFRLSGILYDNQQPLAIINERVVGEGALINGAELVEIRPNYVRLALEGKEVRLKVK